MTKLDLPKDIIKLCANSICNNAHLDGQLRQENVEHCIETLLGPHLSLPKQEAEIIKLKEIPTERTSMIEYLKGEKILDLKWYAKKRFTQGEMRAYNDGIENSIQMIASCMTRLVEQEDTTQIEKIDMDELSLLLYNGSDLEGNSWGADIPRAIKMVAEAVNSLISKQTNE